MRITVDGFHFKRFPTNSLIGTKAKKRGPLHYIDLVASTFTILYTDKVRKKLALIVLDGMDREH